MDRKFICDFCLYPFGRKDHLISHIRKLHNPNSQIEKFKCPFDECGVLSRYKSNWKIHMKKIHRTSDEDVDRFMKEIQKEKVPNDCKYNFLIIFLNIFLTVFFFFESVEKSDFGAAKMLKRQTCRNYL